MEDNGTMTMTRYQNPRHNVLESLEPTFRLILWFSYRTLSYEIVPRIGMRLLMQTLQTRLNNRSNVVNRLFAKKKSIKLSQTEIRKLLEK